MRIEKEQYKPFTITLGGNMKRPHQIIPYKLGQLVHVYGSSNAYPIMAINFVAGGWHIEIEEYGKRYGFFIDDGHITPANPKEYAATKVYKTATGNPLGLIKGGK